LPLRVNPRAFATILVAVVTLAGSAAHAQTENSGLYTVVPTGSLIGFTLYGRALLPITREGRFSEFAGELAYDPEHPRDTRVDLTVYTASVDVNNSGQNQLLRSETFFDVSRFPTLHFTGTVADLKPDGSLTVSGDLTIRGITKSISAPVTLHSSGAQSAPHFETTFQIDRTDFGLDGTPSWGGFKVSIAKKVTIHIAIAASSLATPH
jgi:polyisoprenoid-binding protein YceI